MLKMKNQYICSICHKQLSCKRRLIGHQKTQHTELNETNQDQLVLLRQEIDQLKSTVQCQPSQTVNIICVTDRDNYLDMLTNQIGFDRAIEYIKDCALADISGDCQLIEKMYPQQITFTNQKKTKVKYQTKTGPIVVAAPVLGRTLANNLQNSYLKGVNHLINLTLDRKIHPGHLLEEYDLTLWNAHIFQLSEDRYQSKLMRQLDFPIGGILIPS
jgi:hypothetical protein